MSNNNYSLTLENINPQIRQLEFEVRGPIVELAAILEKELAQGKKKPFDEIIRCNIGDCHAMGQKPLTFLRQVIALCAYPAFLEDDKFPSDAKDRAKRILGDCLGNSMGSYSQSTGIQVVREDIAKYIEGRDGISSDPDNIFLSTGASSAIKSMLQLMCTFKDGKNRAGIMVPIPQYPLYSATNTEFNAYQMNYFLDEENGWGLDFQELERSFNEAKAQCIPKAIVIINPGNPTGHVLRRTDIENVIKFAKNHNLVILADEVYQQNVYNHDLPFHSFKKVMHDIGPPYSNSVELASFMSASKGYMGECGFRGGCCELVNFNPEVKAQLYKLLSTNLCVSTIGQAMMDIVAHPPQPGEPSYNLFKKEKEEVLNALKYKAKVTTDTFNSLPGYQCNPITGAMYAFPKFSLPQRAIEEAKKNNMAPDFFYCKEFLLSHGVCVVSGSGFGQKPGTFHLRMTILPPIEKIEKVLEKFKTFHLQFLQKYGDNKGKQSKL